MPESSAEPIHRLHAASDAALASSPTWEALAAYVDELHREHERFITLMHKGRIGPHMPAMRPKLRRHR